MVTSRVTGIVAFVIFLVVLGVALLRWMICSVPLPLTASPQLAIRPLGTHFFVNDLVGIAGDDTLPAAYVISHSARPAVVRTQGDAVSLAWADAFGVSQDPQLPGWGGTRELPARAGALQLDYLQTMIVGRFDVDPVAAVEVDVDIPWYARVADRGDVELQLISQDSERTSLTLRLKGRGTFQLEALPPPSDGFPVEFEVRNLDVSKIVIGGDARSPATPRFSLQTRDLHSLALGEIDGDAGAEFSVVRGGLRGQLSAKGWRAQDLLYDAGDGPGVIGQEIGDRFPGFDKRGCPGRQSAWVDIDRDRRLELYVVCGRADGDSSGFANQLFRFSESGDVVEEAAAVGLDLGGTGSFRFVDWNGDDWVDLLWVDAEGDVILFANREGRFVEKERVTGKRFTTHQVPQLLLGDFDGDRRPDLFIVHHEGNQLLLNGQTGLSLDGKPQQRGLPARSLAGSWIDFDLDGEIDFISADSGLYRGIGDGRFEAAQAAPNRLLAKFYPAARLVNVEIDGHRQLLIALNRCLPGRVCNWQRDWLSRSRSLAGVAFLQQWLGLLESEEWQLVLIGRAVQEGRNRELALEISGPPTNPHAIGATVDLGDAGRHWVGEAEASHFSQGNFSIYASVERTEPLTASVTWSDGCRDQASIPVQVTSWSIPYPKRCLEASFP